MEISTKLGTWVATTCGNDGTYPGIQIELVRNGIRYVFAWVEVDQSDDDEEPIMKIHTFGTEHDDPIFDKHIRGSELKALYKETRYKIRPEYACLWGKDVTEDTVITHQELERVARGWGMPASQLIYQLIPVDANGKEVDA